MLLLRGESFTLLQCCIVSFLIVLPQESYPGHAPFGVKSSAKKETPAENWALQNWIPCFILNLIQDLSKLGPSFAISYIYEWNMINGHVQWWNSALEGHGQWPSWKQVKESHSTQSSENNLQRYIFKSLWQGLSINLLSLVRTPRAYQTQKDNPNKSLKRTPLIPSEDTLILGNDS